jgi:hypothetical protein
MIPGIYVQDGAAPYDIQRCRRFDAIAQAIASSRPGDIVMTVGQDGRVTSRSQRTASGTREAHFVGVDPGTVSFACPDTSSRWFI